MAYFSRHILPDNTHYITGERLNQIDVQRPFLNFGAAVTVHILFKQGFTYTQIVHLLGTSAFRVGEVVRGEEHPNSGMEALHLLTK
jgi:hypothetical protein